MERERERVGEREKKREREEMLWVRNSKLWSDRA